MSRKLSAESVEEEIEKAKSCLVIKLAVLSAYINIIGLVESKPELIPQIPSINGEMPDYSYIMNKLYASIHLPGSLSTMQTLSSA